MAQVQMLIIEDVVVVCPGWLLMETSPGWCTTIWRTMVINEVNCLLKKEVLNYVEGFLNTF